MVTQLEKSQTMRKEQSYQGLLPTECKQDTPFVILKCNHRSVSTCKNHAMNISPFLDCDAILCQAPC